MSKKTKRGVNQQPTNRPRERRSESHDSGGLCKTIRCGDRFSICGPNGHWFAIVGTELSNELAIAYGCANTIIPLKKDDPPIRHEVGGAVLRISNRGHRRFLLYDPEQRFKFCRFTKAKRQAA